MFPFRCSNALWAFPDRPHSKLTPKERCYVLRTILFAIFVFFVAKGMNRCPMPEMKLFHTAMIESAELLAVMLENHGIESRREKVDPTLDDDDLNQDVRVYVPAEEYDRAYELFFGDSEEEI